MNDRELLELAAKAAGLPVGSASGEYQYRDDGIWVAGMYGTDNGYPLFWNPLIDDRDALRLAVKLRLSLDHNHPADQQPWVAVDRTGCEGCHSPVCCVEDDFEEKDRGAATRRAITRAAAEIERARITDAGGGS